MPQKAKARTGTALPDQAKPDDESEQPTPITDAQASDLKPSGPLGGFNATPNTPTGPSYPSMGGSATEPSDFAKEVNAAGAVSSKGGPPVEDLYVSSGKGPVGRLKSPQQSEATSEAPTSIKLPEFKPPPRPAESTVTGGAPARGVPMFFGEGRLYYRDETGPGKEVRHFFDSAPDTEEAKNGKVFEDPFKGTQITQASEQMGNMLKAQDAINKWKELQAQYFKAHGDEGMLQRIALEARMSGDQGWQATIAKTMAGMVPGVTPEMEHLDAARNNMVLPFMAAFAKGQESLRIPGTTAGQGAPTANDDFETQKAKVDAMQEQLINQAHAIRALYPNGGKEVDRLLAMIRSGGPQQNAPTGTTARSTATSRPTASYEEQQRASRPKTQAEYDAIPKGTLYWDLDNQLRPKK